MNFVIGRQSDFGPESNKRAAAVRKVQVEIAQQDERGAWVDCDDLNDKEKDGKKRNDLQHERRLRASWPPLRPSGEGSH